MTDHYPDGTGSLGTIKCSCGEAFFTDPCLEEHIAKKNTEP